MQILEHIIINGSVHTGCKQHQRVCMQICMQICLCILCERGLTPTHHDIPNTHTLSVAESRLSSGYGQLAPSRLATRISLSACAASSLSSPSFSPSAWSWVGPASSRVRTPYPGSGYAMPYTGSGFPNRIGREANQGIFLSIRMVMGRPPRIVKGMYTIPYTGSGHPK